MFVRKADDNIEFNFEPLPLVWFRRYGSNFYKDILGTVHNIRQRIFKLVITIVLGTRGSVVG
jgi:hypothetical protein